MRACALGREADVDGREAMSRCAGCGYEHGLLGGWCDECIANGKRDSTTGFVVTEHGLPSYPVRGGVYTDASGRKLRVDDVKVGAPDGREVIGAVESFSGDGVPVTDARRVPGAVYSSTPFSTTVAIWARVWRDKVPPADPRMLKVGG